tara:strand:- start:3123 stop:3686 length:564 start_codon:yes stop_codon:yes gene_type:complete
MTLTPIIGNHVFLAGFEGETVDSVVISPTVVPDEAPTTNWRSMGCVRDADYSHVFEGEKRNFCPSPGTYQDIGSTYASTTTKIDIGLKDLTVDSWQLIMGAASIDGSDVFTPGSEGQPRKGWIKVQMYESGTETNLVNLKVWCQIMFGGATKFSSAQTEPTMNLRILNNVLNSGQLLGNAATNALGV